MILVVVVVCCLVAGVFSYAAARLMEAPSGTHQRQPVDETSVWLARVRATRPLPGMERRMRAAQIRQAKYARGQWHPPALVPEPEPAPEPYDPWQRPWADDTGSFTKIAAGGE